MLVKSLSAHPYKKNYGLYGTPVLVPFSLNHQTVSNVFNLGWTSKNLKVLNTYYQRNRAARSILMGQNSSAISPLIKSALQKNQQIRIVAQKNNNLSHCLKQAVFSTTRLEFSACGVEMHLESKKKICSCTEYAGIEVLL